MFGVKTRMWGIVRWREERKGEKGIYSKFRLLSSELGDPCQDLVAGLGGNDAIDEGLAAVGEAGDGALKGAGEAGDGFGHDG